MKIIFKLIKKVTFALAVIYSFNIIMEALNLFIPINLYTIGCITVLGFPGLFLLVGLSAIV